MMYLGHWSVYTHISASLLLTIVAQCFVNGGPQFVLPVSYWRTFECPQSFATKEMLE